MAESDAAHKAQLQRAEDAIHELLDTVADTTEELAKLDGMSSDRLTDLGKHFMDLTKVRAGRKAAQRGAALLGAAHAPRGRRLTDTSAGWRHRPLRPSRIPPPPCRR